MKRQRLCLIARVLACSVLSTATAVHALEPAAEPPSLAADGSAVLKSSREAIAKLRALSFSSTVVDEGPAASASSRWTADVSASRAEAGGWRVLAKGTQAAAQTGSHQPADKPTDKPAPDLTFHVGYDGATAWSLREADQTVMQRSASAVADVEKFFTQQTAGPVVAWDLFAETPLDFGSSKMTIEPQSKPVATVDGIDCDIVTIEQPAKGDEGASFRRLYIAKSDHLPRRFDRVREIPDPKDPAKKTTNTRSLVLSKLKTDGDAVPGAYILSVPDGYAVRTAAEKKRPAPKEKDPLRGPAVRDKDGFLAVGMAAPEWSLKDSEGVEHKLSDYKGKVVFMDFWATWCPPCRAAMPSVQRLHDKYKNKGVVVLGLDFNDNKDPAKYMKEHEFTYLLLLNAEKLADQYKISGIPAFFIVGKDGRIVYTGVGFPGDKAAQDAHDREIEKIIDDALAGKSEVMTPDNKK